MLMFFMLGGVLVSMWLYVRRWLAVCMMLLVMMCGNCVFLGLILYVLSECELRDLVI